MAYNTVYIGFRSSAFSIVRMSIMYNVKCMLWFIHCVSVETVFRNDCYLFIVQLMLGVEERFGNAV